MTVDSAPPVDTAPPSNDQGTPPVDNTQPPAGDPPAGNDQQPAAGDPPAAPQFTVPDAYKDKPWASKIKSPDDLWRQLENTQSLVGRRNPVPNFDEATPQEIEDFLGQMRPADSKAYDFTGGDKEYVASALDPKFADAFHKAGLPPKIANGLIADLRGIINEAGEEVYSPDAFLGEMERTFGNGWETKTNQTRQLVEGNLSPADKAVMDNMPNSHLAMVFRLAANMQKAYGARESGLGGEHKGGGDTGKSVDEVRRDLRKQIGELDRRPHDGSEKQTLVDQLAKTYQTQPAKR